MTANHAIEFQHEITGDSLIMDAIRSEGIPVRECGKGRSVVRDRRYGEEQLN